jgi:hypothetical protein
LRGNREQASGKLLSSTKIVLVCSTSAHNATNIGLVCSTSAHNATNIGLVCSTSAHNATNIGLVGASVMQKWPEVVL